MALSVFLGIWTEDKLRRVKIEGLDLESNVEVLTPLLTKELGEDASKAFELTFCGLSLEDQKPLSSYGITSGVTIHVTKKQNVKTPRTSNPTENNPRIMKQFFESYRNFKQSPSFRSTLHRLENPAELDKVIEAVPGLQHDPIAIAFISKPELFTQMEDKQTGQLIADRNPLILQAAIYIVTEFHKSTSSNSSPAALQSAPASGHSYSLDALSDDDEEMEGDGPSSGAITAAQLAAALAAASAAPPARITPGPLQEALYPAGGPSRYPSQLRQMREFGLNDEERNLRALALSAGDLQAAINLLFSGILDD